MDYPKCSPRPAVSAVIVDRGRVLLVKRGCEPNLGLWSLPGGSIEPGETAREALVREVEEETSLRVEIGDLAAVHDVIARDGDAIRFHYVIISFYARVTAGEPMAASDAAEVSWILLSEVGNLPTTPGLIDRLASLGLA